MSRNGSGTYNLPAGNPVVTGTTISSSWANTTLNDIATALTGSLAADGQTPVTGNFNVNNNRITNLADPSSAQDGATKAYVDTADALALLKANNLSDVANATTARGNLTAAKSGANSDITSLTGLTTPLTVAQGGIGAATLTANAVVLGNGTSAVTTVAPSTSGNVLTSNGTTWASTAPSIVGAKGQSFTSSGTFTIPTGITAVKVTVIGGGGNGGNAGGGQRGGGGGAGGTAISYLTSLTSGNTISVTVGAAVGNSSIQSGTQSITTVTGGAGTTGTSNQTGWTLGGAGGTATNGTININGQRGGDGPTSMSSFGGSTSFGGGGTGGYTSGVLPTAGVGYGSGGGGAGDSSSGASGAAGIVIFEW